MKNKHILILGLVFLILVVVVVVSRSSGPEPQTEIHQDTLVGEFDTGQAGHIEFYHGEKPARKVILKKKNGNWTVPSRFGARADTKRIDKLLAGLPGLSGEARVRELSLFGEFDITEEQAVHLIVRDTGGSEITHLLVGKAGPDWRSGFARKAGGNSVYLVNVALLSLLGVSRPMTGALAGFEAASPTAFPKALNRPRATSESFGGRPPASSGLADGGIGSSVKVNFTWCLDRSNSTVFVCGSPDSPKVLVV